MLIKDFIPTVFYGGKTGYITYQAYAGGTVNRVFNDFDDAIIQIIDLIISKYLTREEGENLVRKMREIDGAVRERPDQNG